jgi:hypothetical protein
LIVPCASSGTYDTDVREHVVGALRQLGIERGGIRANHGDVATGGHLGGDEAVEPGAHVGDDRVIRVLEDHLDVAEWHVAITNGDGDRVGDLLRGRVVTTDGAGARSGEQKKRESRARHDEHAHNTTRATS